MPRTYRGHAQKLAAKRRKRRLLASERAAASAPDIAAAQREDPATATASSEPPARGTVARPLAAVRPVTVVRPRVVRRPFSSYAEEYRYVAADLRRVALVSGGLLAALIVLSFFIR